MSTLWARFERHKGPGHAPGLVVGAEKLKAANRAEACLEALSLTLRSDYGETTRIVILEEGGREVWRFLARPAGR